MPSGVAGQGRNEWCPVIVDRPAGPSAHPVPRRKRRQPRRPLARARAGRARTQGSPPRRPRHRTPRRRSSPAAFARPRALTRTGRPPRARDRGHRPPGPAPHRRDCRLELRPPTDAPPARAAPARRRRARSSPPRAPPRITELAESSRSSRSPPGCRHRQLRQRHNNQVATTPGPGQAAERRPRRHRPLGGAPARPASSWTLPARVPVGRSPSTSA